MIFKRFYDRDLAQASFLVGCSKTKKALVVDPRRDYQVYLDYARAQGLRVEVVAETHIHADYLSGARELAAAIGATLVVSTEGGTDWQYSGLQSFEQRLLQDGERFAVGQVHVEAVHTPGHTPEHLSYAFYDDETDAVSLILTGDFLFVGTPGRPDLLDTTGIEKGSMKKTAAVLFDSLKRFVDRVPHDVPIWPGHGAGSACGRSLGALPCTTLGYELKHRPWGEFLRSEDREGFVDYILEGQPDSPTYFGRMKEWNRDGFPLRNVQRRPPRLTRSYFPTALENGAIAVDLRSREEFSSGHLKSAIHLPLGPKLATWAGWVLPKPESIVLITDETTSADEAGDILLRIGQDDFVGFIPFSDLEDHRDVVKMPAVEAEEALEIWQKEAARFIDVRSRNEFLEGHIPQAQHFPITTFQEVLDDILRGQPLLVYCGSGARAAVAASILQREGVEDVVYFEGSMRAWREKNYPEQTPDE